MNLVWTPPGGGQANAVQDDLVRLYCSTYSTAEYFDIFHCRKIRDCWLLRMSSEGELKHLMVLSPEQQSVVLLNEMITLRKPELDLLAEAVFSKFPSVQRLVVNRVRFQDAESFLLGKQGFRVQRINDAVLDLPGTVEGYRQLLGGQTRKHISYYHNRLRKTFRDFQITFTSASQINPEQIGRIVEMNRGRLESKGGRSSIDKRYEERLLAIARAYGFLCLCFANGEMIAGSICTKVGHEAYLHVIAHDVEYDRFNAGQVCLFNSILSLLEAGCTRFHMLWGQSEYKYRFGAKDENLGFYCVYRSPFQLVAGVAGLALGSTARRIMRAPARLLRKLPGVW